MQVACHSYHGQHCPNKPCGGQHCPGQPCAGQHCPGQPDICNSSPFYITPFAPWETNKGIMGQVGATGPAAGSTLIIGSQGPTGDAAIVGQDGEGGIASPDGINGESGTNGFAGVSESGLRGDNGDVGSVNQIPGVAGLGGVDGDQGLDGFTGETGLIGLDGAGGLRIVLGPTGSSGTINAVSNIGLSATSVLGTSVFASPADAGCEIPVWDGVNLRPMTFSGGTDPIRTIFTVPDSHEVLIRVTFRIAVFGASATPGILLIGFHNSNVFTNTPTYGYYAQTYNLNRDGFVIDFIYNSTTLPAPGTNVTLYLVGAVTLPPGISDVLITAFRYRTIPPTPDLWMAFPTTTIVVIDLNNTLILPP